MDPPLAADRMLAKSWTEAEPTAFASAAWRPRLASIAMVLGTAAVYVVAANLGLRLALVADQVTLVWPPTGIALAALLVLGNRITPGIALGAFVANITHHEPVGTACGIALGNTLEAVIGAWLLRRVGFDRALERLRHVLALIVLAALGSTVVAATIGVTSLCLGGVQPWNAFASLWWTWWVGDAMGDLVMAPVLLVWSCAPRSGWRPRRVAEGVALLGALVLVGVLVFVQPDGSWLISAALPYKIFPFVIWGALRFGQRGAVTVSCLAATIAILGAVQGWGPFSVGTPHENLVALQLFNAVVAISALLLGAAIAERDGAERRSASDFARLQMSEGRLRLALDAGRMGAWDWNLTTGRFEWSENLEGLYGLPPGGFGGTYTAFQALVHPEDRDTVHRAVTRAVEDGPGYDVEFRTVRPDGSIRWMAATGRVLCDATGRAARLIGVGTDITDRKRLGDELEQRAAQLADADRRKDEFLAMLAHELRNPLAPLSTAVHLLQRDGADRGQVVQMVDRQVRHLARLVDDLLDVSRITQGKITLRKELVLLSTVVEQAVEMVRTSIDARGHAFTVSLPGDPVRLDADPARLAQVVGNLLSNAAKYTPRGGSIWLTAEREGNGIAIRIRDTGIGIAADFLPFVFDLFAQGDASLDRARGGLGIGLTVVRNLVGMHGGHVEARSAGLGQGSEFVVHLPVSQEATPERRPARRPVHATTGAALRILVVEDNQDAAESLAIVLGLWGYAVETAFDGLAALDAAARYRPDLVLSDLGLPGMDGYELARRLRAQNGLDDVVLVALSGYGRDEDKRRALDAGFDHHLVKPPNLDALAELLRQVAGAAGEPARAGQSSS